MKTLATATLGALLIWVCAARGQAPDFSTTKAAAERGDAIAQSDLGVMLVDGLGVPKDEVEGTKWFRKAAEQNLAAGQYHLGVMYHDGRGVPKDMKEAFKWALKAAEQGSAPAQSDLGFMFGEGQVYLNGYGVKKDIQEAIRRYRLAAGQTGTAAATAQEQLARLDSHGIGVPIAIACNSLPHVNRQATDFLRWPYTKHVA